LEQLRSCLRFVIRSDLMKVAILGLALCIAIGVSSSTGAQVLAAPVREGFAEVPGAHIWYEDTGGQGIPVIFLHAASGSSRNWDGQFPAFTAAGYRCIAYDRRGWGRSVSIAGGSQPGTAADDLQGLVEYLRIDRFHIVATAAGGGVALDYVVSFPQRVRSLVVANAAVGQLEDEKYQQLTRSSRSPQIDALPVYLRELGPSYRAEYPEGTGRWIALNEMSQPNGPPASPQTTRNHLTVSSLQSLKVPLLMMTGDADLLAPPPFVRFFTERLKGIQSLIIPEAGHSAYWERPERFNRAVLDFIRKH
jgi:pimeloyl-ACP methyl ester carboxylesterase